MGVQDGGSLAGNESSEVTSTSSRARGTAIHFAVLLFIGHPPVGTQFATNHTRTTSGAGKFHEVAIEPRLPRPGPISFDAIPADGDQRLGAVCRRLDAIPPQAE
jgi:hypothetical protein